MFKNLITRKFNKKESEYYICTKKVQPDDVWFTKNAVVMGEKRYNELMDTINDLVKRNKELKEYSDEIVRKMKEVEESEARLIQQLEFFYKNN